MRLELLKELTNFLLVRLLHVRKRKQKVFGQSNRHVYLFGRTAIRFSGAVVTSLAFHTCQPARRALPAYSYCAIVSTQIFWAGQANSATATISPLLSVISKPASGKITAAASAAITSFRASSSS